MPIFSNVETADCAIRSSPSTTDLTASLLRTSSEIELCALSILSFMLMISFAKFETPYFKASA